MDLQGVLREARVIAVVGCSGRPTRTSHSIARYLLLNGYEVIPVNPNYEEVLDRRCYPDLLSVPEEVEFDIVNIFRNPRYAADAVRDAIAWSRAHGTKPVVWTQLGVSTPEASLLAREAGLPYVANRCILAEHNRHA